MKKLNSILLFLMLITISCVNSNNSDSYSQIKNCENPSCEKLSFGMGGAGGVLDAGVDGNNTCPPPETEPGCSHCGNTIVDPSKVDKLCQNFDGLSGGVPSEWLYEVFSTCVCTGDCSDLCQSACTPSQTQYTIDSTLASTQCITCIQTQAHSSTDPHGCGAQLSLCENDFTP